MSDWDYGRSTDYDFDDFRSGQGSSDYYDSGSGSSMRGRAQEGMHQVQSGARQASDKARQGFDSLFHRHPITLGLGALALGMAVGMLVPGTRQEDKWMGDASSRVKERAGETAKGFGDVAKASFQEARDTAMREMEGHGVDPGNLKESVKDAASEVREAAEHTVENARKAAEEEAERKNLR